METSPHCLSSSNNPFFSSIVTFYMLIFLYFPHVFLKVFISPLLISTLIILVSLLRLGVSQMKQQQQQQQQPPPSISLNETRNDGSEPESEPEPELELESKKVETDQRQGGEVAKPQCNNMDVARSKPEPGPTLEPETCDPGKLVGSDTAEEAESFQCWAEPEPAYGPKMFLEWDVGAPLEVIYEAYEGEEEGEEVLYDAFSGNNNESCNKAGILERYPSLSRYYPESDSDSYSDSSSSTSLDDVEGDEREGLIEIALDYGYKFDKEIINYMMMKANNNKVKHSEEFHHFDDEENLIEIDISPTKKLYDFPR